MKTDKLERFSLNLDLTVEAFETFPLEDQYNKWLEECLELANAIIKRDANKIIEELIDVHTMNTQFLFFFLGMDHTNVKIHRWKRLKEKKLKAIIEEWNLARRSKGPMVGGKPRSRNKNGQWRKKRSDAGVPRKRV